ncbi:MAG: hypothetical protein ABIS09_05930 [Sphingomicrobium sp.]
MGQHDSGAVAIGGVGNNLPQREVGAAAVAIVPTHMQAARLIVDVSNPKTFAGRVGIGQTTGKKVAGGGEAVKFQGEFDTLIPHAS